jgi:hypothetical protein
MSQELDPIPPEQARAILDAAVNARLGPGWEDEGWIVVSRHDYMLRLNRQRTTIDFYVDLLGQVSVEESATTDANQARLIAWFLLAASVFIAILLARIAGL